MSTALLFLIVALVLIAVELFIMQFSVFWFLFFGIGALIASLVGFIFPDLSVAMVTGVFAVASLVAGLALFAPLRRWQNQPSPIAGHDAIGQTAEVIETITESRSGKVQWSGSEWPAQLFDGETGEFAVGENVVIRKLEGIRLYVARN